MSKSEKRRFTRVHFRGDVGKANRILGAKVIWPNQEVSDVYDLSFKGLAVSRPGLVDLKPAALQSLRLELGDLPSILLPARVAWKNEQHVGLEFGDISAEAHLSLNAFLTDKLIGQNLHSVGRQFFSEEATFDHWYQGPNGTHLFIWCDKADPSRVLKVHLELGDDVWEFENRRVIKGEQFSLRAIQLLGQLLVTEFRLRDVIEKVAVST